MESVRKVLDQIFSASKIVSAFPVFTLTGYNNQSVNDNTNILWNSPSLGKITAIGYSLFYKTTPFPSFDWKKQGQTHLFLWYSPLFRMRQIRT